MMLEFTHLAPPLLSIPVIGLLVALGAILGWRLCHARTTPWS